MEDNDRRFIGRENEIEVVGNARLQCAGCRFVDAEDVFSCGQYEEKPGYVINGSKPCPLFEPAE